MKETGIIRRIDELGRIVIPKEIRKQMKINNGENIEIYISDDNIILKKYSAVKNIEDFIQILIDSIYTSCKFNIVVTDTSNIIAVSGINKKNVLGKEISNDLINIIKNKKNIESNNLINVTENLEISGNYKINLINVNGDINGLIIFFGDKDINNNINLFNTVSNFLSKYLEE
mgnify:FL=1